MSSIGRWIARDNPYRADTYVEELRGACQAIGDDPERHAPVFEGGTLRKKLFRPYLIFYRIRRRDVLIVSVRHGRGDNRGMR